MSTKFQAAGAQPAHKSCCAPAEGQDLEPGRSSKPRIRNNVNSLPASGKLGVVIDLEHVKACAGDPRTRLLKDAVRDLVLGRLVVGTLCAVAPIDNARFALTARDLGVAAAAWYPGPHDTSRDQALALLVGAEAIKLLLRRDVRDVIVVSDVMGCTRLDEIARAQEKRLVRVVMMRSAALGTEAA